MADSLRFVPECEPWTIYKLEDGSILKVRVILTKCEVGSERQSDGKPLYLNKFQLIQEVEFPDGHQVNDAIQAAARRGGQ